MKSVLVLTSQIERKILTFSIRHKTLRSRQPAQELKAPSRCTRHSAHRPQRKLCSAANDPQPQTDPQTGNVPQIGTQMIRNRKRSPIWSANDPVRKRRMAWNLFLGLWFQFLT